MADESQLEVQERSQDERPDWLPANFKSPEDLAKAYDESRREMSRAQQAEREAKDQYEQHLLQQQEQETQFQQQHPPQVEEIAAQYGLDPDALPGIARLVNDVFTNRYQQDIAPRLAPDENVLASVFATNARVAEQDIVAKFPDFVEYKDQIGEYVQQRMPYYTEDAFQTPDKIAAVLTDAYKAVKLDALSSSTEQTLEETIAAQRAAKLQAQTITGSGGRPPAQDQWESKWAAIQAADTTSYRDIAGS